MPPPSTALLAGATGLVGSHLLDALLEAPRYTAVHTLGRRPPPATSPRLHHHPVDFAKLDTLPLPPADTAFCTLGTTIKKAGSQEAFRAVDHDAVLAFARAARRAGVTHFLVVTALGADAKSRVFYNRVKGETEAALATVGFDALTIVRPSLLLGERTERRPGEHAAIVASRLLAPLLRPLAARPIEARAVARALVALAEQPQRGVRVVLSRELHALGH